VAVEIDQFPASDFDGWASKYDLDVLDEAHYPFAGYQLALDTVVRLAEPKLGMRVLDVGTGTGNLAALFAARGCSLWGTDFSPVMLEAARRKLPQVQFVLADARHGWPTELPPVFERIVSAYTFHHFELAEKIRILAGLSDHLTSQGQLVMADIAFPDHASQENVRQLVGDAWDDEYYWLADETIAALSEAGLKAAFSPVSFCAGVFLMEKQ
jgi:cyclopropane fatty-acyl-phospholipid synthase-like methyltransferase